MSKARAHNHVTNHMFYYIVKGGKIMAIIKEATKEKLSAKKAEIKTKTTEFKDKAKETVEKNNILKKENRVRIKENAAHKTAVDKLALAYSHNNVKYIDKFIKNTDKANVENLWREAIYDHGGKLAADMLYNEIVEGANYITDPNKYQSMISKYDHYNLALLIEDGKDIDPDFIIDSLADGINDAADKLGYEEIYHFEKTDEEGIPIVEFDQETNMAIPTIQRDEKKILLNNKKVDKEKPITEVINGMEIEPAQKEKLLKTETKRQQKIVEIHKDDLVDDFVWPTDEELEKAKEEYKANYLKEARTTGKNKKAEDSSSDKTANSTAANETKSVKRDPQTGKADKIIEVIEKEIGKPEEQKMKTSAKKTNLKEVVDPFEEILGQPAPAGEEKTPEKESVSSTAKSRKTGGKATAKKSV